MSRPLGPGRIYSFDPAKLKIRVDRDAPMTRRLPDGTEEDIIGVVFEDTLVVHPDRLEELDRRFGGAKEEP